MALYPVYPLFPITIESGQGATVTDSEGKQYLDLYGGHAVVSIGHSHPHYLDALRRQAEKLVFYSNSVENPLQERLSEMLGQASGYPDYSLFLVNSGAEANENALKLASFHTGKKRVIAFNKAFHGRTSAAVAVTDNPKIQAPINSTAPVTFLPLNDLKAVEAELAKDDVAAVIIEGIQGVGGIQIPETSFMVGLRNLTQKHGAVLILDEIQSGYGRTGKFFAHQHYGIKPDIITMAKGIANGFPMGALLISPIFKPQYGQLGTTFGGNHLACAAAIAVLEVMQRENLIERAAKTGDYLMSKLKALHGVGEVRGRGLMIAIEQPYPVKNLRQSLIFNHGVFTGAASTNIIRLLPPLCLTTEQADDFIERFTRALAEN